MSQEAKMFQYIIFEVSDKGLCHIMEHYKLNPNEYPIECQIAIEAMLALAED